MTNNTTHIATGGGEFLTQLRVVQLQARPRARWQLANDLIYWSALKFEFNGHGTVKVPAGFETDFASVPRLPLAYYLAGGKADAAAVVHDWLYFSGAMSRRMADDIFREAILAQGYSQFTARIMWAGVRVGGGAIWRARRGQDADAFEDQ